MGELGSLIRFNLKRMDSCGFWKVPVLERLMKHLLSTFRCSIIPVKVVFSDCSGLKGFKGVQRDNMFQLSSHKNLDVTDLQTFAILWSQVNATRHNKGNLVISVINRPPKFNEDS